MSISLRQLEIFREVARHRSYTRAAEALHLTQPAVFAQVRKLEEQLGAALIERIGRQLHLTEAGEIVLEGAGLVLDEVERLRMALADLQGMVRGRLKLGVISTAQYEVPAEIGAFCARHPGIDVRMTVGNREELLARLRANEDDLYILGTPPADLEIEAVRYAENPLVLVAPPRHPLAGRARVEPRELAAEPFILRERGSGTRAATERFLAEAGIAPPVRMELGANEAVKQAVMAGLGLAVLSRGTARLEIDAGLLVELPVAGFPIRRHWHAIWPRGKRLSVAARAFLDQLRAEAQ